MEERKKELNNDSSTQKFVVCRIANTLKYFLFLKNPLGHIYFIKMNYHDIRNTRCLNLPQLWPHSCEDMAKMVE